MTRGQRHALYAGAALAVVAGGVWWWRTRNADEETVTAARAPDAPTVAYSAPRRSPSAVLF